MASHSSILAWKNLMDREAWWATIHRVMKESDTTKQLNDFLKLNTNQVHLSFFFNFVFLIACALQLSGSQFPDQGWHSRLLQWKHVVLTTGPPRKPQQSTTS